MTTFRIGFFALAPLTLLSAAWARPALVTPNRLSLPSGINPLVRYTRPAIDGDTLMVSRRSDQGHAPALQNAASVAGLLLTTEVMIAEAPKDEEHAHGGAPGGIGGFSRPTFERQVDSLL